VTQQNSGAAAARNTGVKESKGKYVAFLDSDDLWLPGKLNIMVSAMERKPSASLAFSEHFNFQEPGVECGASSIGHAPSVKELMEVWLPPILISTWMVNRKIFERSGGFCETFKGQGYEDSWMLLLLRELGEFVHIPEKLTLYRVGKSGETADKYAPGLPIFIALARNRYAERSKPLVRNARNLQCRWMLSKSAYQMNRGDRLGAVRTIVRIARIRPAYFFGSEFTGRLLLPQNMKRLRNLTTVSSHAQGENGRYPAHRGNA
jgi:glycosyltransferase involved in cell wall biosynthesis